MNMNTCRLSSLVLCKQFEFFIDPWCNVTNISIPPSFCANPNPFFFFLILEDLTEHQLHKVRSNYCVQKKNCNGALQCCYPFISAAQKWFCTRTLISNQLCSAPGACDGLPYTSLNRRKY